MEFTEEQLDNVVAGSQFSDDIALQHQSLYRRQAIESLKKQKEMLLKQDELTQEELDKITAGVPHFGER